MKHTRRFFSFALLLLAAVMPVARAADLTITPANLLPSSKARYLNGIAGAAITGGQPVTLSPTTGRYVLADADDSALLQVEGLAAHSAAAGQPLAILIEDPELTLGATLSTSAPIYVLSSTPGGIAPSADIGVGEYPIVLLIATSTTKCVLKPRVLAGTAPATAP